MELYKKILIGSTLLATGCTAREVVAQPHLEPSTDTPTATAAWTNTPVATYTEQSIETPKATFTPTPSETFTQEPLETPTANMLPSATPTSVNYLTATAVDATRVSIINTVAADRESQESYWKEQMPDIKRMVASIVVNESLCSGMIVSYEPVNLTEVDDEGIRKPSSKALVFFKTSSHCLFDNGAPAFKPGDSANLLTIEGHEANETPKTMNIVAAEIFGKQTDIDVRHAIAVFIMDIEDVRSIERTSSEVISTYNPELVGDCYTTGYPTNNTEVRPVIDTLENIVYADEYRMIQGETHIANNGLSGGPVLCLSTDNSQVLDIGEAQYKDENDTVTLGVSIFSAEDIEEVKNVMNRLRQKATNYVASESQ